MGRDHVPGKGLDWMASALFVDLPNFYSSLHRTKAACGRTLRDYFLGWLDLDILAQHLTEESCPVWVFHSGKRIGPSSYRVEGPYLNDYISRINRQRGVTARDVNIPGEQREPVTVICRECDKPTQAEWQSEKGIDASLSVHLFDTMQSWDTAYILSEDADFVPAVRSLRRQGKLVNAVGFSHPSPALVRECYEYVDLTSRFPLHDLAAFQALGANGLAHHWLCADVCSTNDATDNIVLYMERPRTRDSIKIVLSTRSNVDLASRYQRMEAFKERDGHTILRVDELHKMASLWLTKLSDHYPRRLVEKFCAALPELAVVDAASGPSLFAAVHEFNDCTKAYGLVGLSEVDSM